MAISLLILNGPGTANLGKEDTNECVIPSNEDIHHLCRSHCESLDIRLDFRQSDDVQELCGILEMEQANCDALLINPYSRTASSLEAAESYNVTLAGLTREHLSIIELHLTNILAELDPEVPPLRGPAGKMGLVCGMGSKGYALAISALAGNCRQNTRTEHRSS